MKKIIYLSATAFIISVFSVSAVSAMTTEDMAALYSVYTRPTVLGASATATTSTIPAPLNAEQQKTMMQGLKYAAGSSMIVPVPLKEGSKGDSVKKLQMFLGAKNYFSAEVTGYFGPKTKMAVKAFQAEKGLKSDGLVGPNTRSAISGDVTELAQ